MQGWLRDMVTSRSRHGSLWEEKLRSSSFHCLLGLSWFIKRRRSSVELHHGNRCKFNVARSYYQLIVGYWKGKDQHISVRIRGGRRKVSGIPKKKVKMKSKAERARKRFSHSSVSHLRASVRCCKSYWIIVRLPMAVEANVVSMGTWVSKEDFLDRVMKKTSRRFWLHLNST